MKPMITWVDIPPNSDFTIYNLPFGVFSTDGKSPRVGMAIGEQIVDLSILAKADLLQVKEHYFLKDRLNDFIALGKSITNKVRTDVQQLLINEGSPLRNMPDALVPQHKATMHLPVQIGDYTDFYSSLEHATNVGKMFRDPENALLPNWKHLPVGYHGRSSSIVVSGTDIHRPKGQVMPKGEDHPVFKASGRLDFELEMAFIVGRETALGESISVEQASDYIFGMVLFNDWSARDIQKWEYVPLGPFLGKSFASSISPWVVTMEALEPFKVSGPKQDPEVLPYLKSEGTHNYDIDLEVTLAPEHSEPETICRSNFKYMYWNMAQQLSHHTVNGCNVKVGDMMASGTISGKDETAFGSMLELSWGGKKTIQLKNGQTRTFIEDNDIITMKGFAEKDFIRVGFGEVSGKILPAKNNI